MAYFTIYITSLVSLFYFFTVSFFMLQVYLYWDYTIIIVILIISLYLSIIITWISKIKSCLIIRFDNCFN